MRQKIQLRTVTPQIQKKIEEIIHTTKETPNSYKKQEK